MLGGSLNESFNKRLQLLGAASDDDAAVFDDLIDEVDKLAEREVRIDEDDDDPGMSSRGIAYYASDHRAPQALKQFAER